MDAVQLSDEAVDVIRSLLAEWVILNKVNGRYLIDALIAQENIQAAHDELDAYNPNIIGQWDEHGTLISESFDSADYIAHLPPIITLDENDNVVTTPRTEAVEIHRFGGWSARSFN